MYSTGESTISWTTGVSSRATPASAPRHDPRGCRIGLEAWTLSSLPSRGFCIVCRLRVPVGGRLLPLSGENLQDPVHVLLGRDAFSRREKREQGDGFFGERGRVRLVVSVEQVVSQAPVLGHRRSLFTGRGSSHVQHGDGQRRGPIPRTQPICVSR